jgi:xylulokinase
VSWLIHKVVATYLEIPLEARCHCNVFVNGSLAREEVKDKFGYDWGQFTAALCKTPPGNDDKIMVPFFRPEISPRVDLEAPILKG